MAQNYASRVQPTVDEVFRLKSVTEGIINKNIRLDYTGVNAVTIYGVATVAENTYVRSGVNRFGALAELDTTTQTFTLTQDKSFTYSIDRGNYEDSMMITEVGSTLQRQLEVVCVPNTDIYRLSRIGAYAAANAQVTTVALTSTNIYTSFLNAGILLDDRLVPAAGRVAYVTPATYALLKQDTNFIKPSEMAQNMLKTGVVGEVDGVAIIKVPTTYLPANFGFVILHDTVLVAPHKFDTFRTLTDVQGVDGWVVEGRRYYDAFVPLNSGKAIQVHKIAV